MQRVLILLTLTALCLTGCGWQLRGFSQYNLLDEVQLVASNRYGPMALAVKNAMREYSVAENEDAAWQLEIGEEELRRRTVAVTSIGSASQYELNLTVPFSYRQRLPGQSTHAVLPQTLSATRVYDFDFRNTVAKTEEEQVLITEMRNELARRILQQNPAADAQINGQD